MPAATSDSARLEADTPWLCSPPILLQDKKRRKSMHSNGWPPLLLGMASRYPSFITYYTLACADVLAAASEGCFDSSGGEKLVEGRRRLLVARASCDTGVDILAR